jgi:hypothetical protein
MVKLALGNVTLASKKYSVNSPSIETKTCHNWTRNYPEIKIIHQKTESCFEISTKTCFFVYALYKTLLFQY